MLSAPKLISGDRVVILSPSFAAPVVCVGVPFGHTRPQWIVPYGDVMTLDGSGRTVSASY